MESTNLKVKNYVGTMAFEGEQSSVTTVSFSSSIFFINDP